MTAKNPVLELQRITKSYPGVVALDRVDFAVYENEIVGLVGENGAGKSTLMKILIGLIQPDEGSYRLRGKLVALRDPASATRLGVGMVFQDGSLVPNLSIMENLFLCHESSFRRFGLLSKRAMQEAAYSVLELVRVDTDLDTPIAETTPEVRQMVEVARLLWLARLYNQRNPILILDEPTTVLTENERQTLFSILTEIKSQTSISIQVKATGPMRFRTNCSCEMLHSGRISMNSSPPMRTAKSPPRTVRLRAAPNSWSARSPTGWP